MGWPTERWAFNRDGGGSGGRLFSDGCLCLVNGPDADDGVLGGAGVVS